MLQSITIEDLQHLRYRGNIPLGIAINVTFDNENSTAVIINKSDIPKESAKLSDIKRLNRIASIVKSTDHVKDKTHQGDLIKALSIRLMKDPNSVSFSASSVKMLADLYSYSQKLEENRLRIQRNVSKDKRSTMTRQYLLEQADLVSSVLYSAGQHYCSSAEKKTLKQFCFEKNIPYWIFVRMITKGYVNDTPHESLYKLLSSKVLGKGLQLRFEEMVKDDIWNPLSELAKNSEFIRTNLVLNKDEILPQDYLTDKPKLEERMNQSVIPIIPLYSLKENLEAKRTCVPLVLKEDPIFLPQQHTIALMQLMVGFRRKQLSPKRFWAIIGATGQFPDLKSTIPHREQMVKLLNDQSNIDRFLEGSFKESDLDQKAKIEKIYLAAFGTNIAESSMSKYVDFAAGKRTVVTVPKANAFREAFTFKIKDMKPVLTETDQKNIESDKLRLPKSSDKKYNFPSGLMPGTEAVRLLKKVKPKDAVFHNLFYVFEKLFSSFESKAVQEKAVSLAFTEMARLKGSAFLFEGQDLSPQDENPEDSEYDY